MIGDIDDEGGCHARRQEVVVDGLGLERFSLGGDLPQMGKIETLCNNGNSTLGSGYVTYYLEAPLDKDCTFDISRINASSEF